MNLAKYLANILCQLYSPTPTLVTSSQLGNSFSKVVACNTIHCIQNQIICCSYLVYYIFIGNGGWNNWSEWVNESDASIRPILHIAVDLANCSYIKTTRYRECNNPTHLGAGIPCQGILLVFWLIYCRLLLTIFLPQYKIR